jgi:hypothetical protein
MVFQGSKNYPQKVKYNDIIKMQKLFDSVPRFRKNSISHQNYKVELVKISEH